MIDRSEWKSIPYDFATGRLEMRVAQHAQKTPSAPAIISPERTLSWQELDQEANRLAGWLRDRGAKAGDHIGWLSRNGPEFPVLLVAARRLRLVLVGLNWRLASGEVADQLARLPMKMIVGDAQFLQELGNDFMTLTTCPAFHTACEFEPIEAADAPERRDIAAVIFTSGSSGRAKPVAYELDAFESHICAPVSLGLHSAARLMIIAPQFHSAGWVWTSYGLFGGCPQIIMPSANPTAMLAAVEKHRVTHAQWLPTMLHLALAEQQARPRDLSSLEVIHYGASAIAPQLLADTMREFGCDFCQVYGLTETAGQVGHLPPSCHRRDWGASGPPTVYPDPGIEVRVTDRNRQPVAYGEEGLIEVRMPVNAPWYVTPEGLRSVADDDGWISTHDLGRLSPDGHLTVLGRDGDMIITGGENVYPLEVENAIATLPQVDEVGVFPLPDSAWGQKICAAIRIRDGHTLTTAELLTHCRDRLAGYKLPKDIFFIDALPRNATGKVVRSKLPDIAKTQLKLA